MSVYFILPFGIFLSSSLSVFCLSLFEKVSSSYIYFSTLHISIFFIISTFSFLLFHFLSGFFYSSEITQLPPKTRLCFPPLWAFAATIALGLAPHDRGSFCPYIQLHFQCVPNRLFSQLLVSKRNPFFLLSPQYRSLPGVSWFNSFQWIQFLSILWQKNGDGYQLSKLVLYKLTMIKGCWKEHYRPVLCYLWKRNWK